MWTNYENYQRSNSYKQLKPPIINRQSSIVSKSWENVCWEYKSKTSLFQVTGAGKDTVKIQFRSCRRKKKLYLKSLHRNSFFVNFQRLKQKWTVLGWTGRVTLCSCPWCLLPCLLIEAEAGLLCTGSVVSFSERKSKTNHQWEVKLLQCHSDNPHWCRHIFPLPSSVAVSWQGQICCPTCPMGP